MDFEGFGRALYIVAYLQDQDVRRRGKPLGSYGGARQKSLAAPGAPGAESTAAPPNPSKPPCAITRQVASPGDASGARVGPNPGASLPKPRGPDPEEEERKVVEGLLQAGDLDAAIEACGPMAVRVWLEAMSRRNPARTRIRATEAVMARVRPVKGVEERRATVHIHFSQAEREAIETVCREVGVALPLLNEPVGK